MWDAPRLRPEAFTGARDHTALVQGEAVRAAWKDALAVVDHQVPASPTDRAMLSAASPCSTPCAFGRYGRAVAATVVEATTQTPPRATAATCSSAAVEPSYVLRGIGLSDELAHSSIRLSLGRFTSEQDVQRAAEIICQVVTRLRAG